MRYVSWRACLRRTFCLHCRNRFYYYC
jgi:hypothetical protein